MASVSFSVQSDIAKQLDKYRLKHRLGSRTQAINHLLKMQNQIGNGLDQNGEPV
jgi:hypothetical protein